MTKKIEAKSNGVKLTEEEIQTDPRVMKIKPALETIINTLQEEPYGSILCSICLPQSDNTDLITSAYVGDSQTQIFQLDKLAKLNPQFMEDLQLWLEIRIKRQMKEHGTTGNSLADKMLDSLNKNDLVN